MAVQEAEATEAMGQGAGVVPVTRVPCTLPGQLRLQHTPLEWLVEATLAPVEEDMEVQVVEATGVPAVEVMEVAAVEPAKVQVVEVETYRVNYKPWPPWVELEEDLVEAAEDVELWVEVLVEVMAAAAVVEVMT